MVSGILRNISVRDFSNNNTTLGKFQEDNNVLDNPTHTIIIAMYCVLVSVAGRKIVGLLKNILCTGEKGA